MKKYIKGYMAGVMTTLLIVVTTSIVLGQASLSQIDVLLNSVNLSLEGQLEAEVDEAYTLSDGRTRPYSILYDGTTYLPIRKIAELLDLEITWDQDQKLIDLSAQSEAVIDKSTESEEEETADTSSDSFIEPSGDIQHYGGAIITEKQVQAPDDIYTDSGNLSTDEYEGMTKKRLVYGLTFYASDSIPDSFINKVARTFMDMFDGVDEEDREIQEEILKNLYEYKACLPIILEDEEEDIPDELIEDYSVCDVIYKLSDDQVMEVVEHLLHAITDVGLNYSFPEKWGFDEGSDISLYMEEAIDEGYYDIEDYEEEFEEEDDDVVQRILVQEFAYWLISSEWDIQETYGPNEKEWILRTPEDLEKYLEGADDLYKDTIEGVVNCPDQESLEALEN